MLPRLAVQRSSHFVRSFSVRLIHQATLATPTLPSSYLPPTQRPSDISAELERRVQALEEAAVAEVFLSFLPSYDQRSSSFLQKAALESPSYSEQDLLLLYEDLLTFPETDSQPDPADEKLAQFEHDLSTVHAADQRLYVVQDGTAHSTHSDPQRLESSVQPYRRVLDRAHDIISRVEAVRSSLADGTVRDSVPISVLSLTEYESLVRVCVRQLLLILCTSQLILDSGSGKRWRCGREYSKYYEGTYHSRSVIIYLTPPQRSGMPSLENAVTEVLTLYAVDGNVAGVENILATYLTGAYFLSLAVPK
jgi:hypothetical protein